MKSASDNAKSNEPTKRELRENLWEAFFNEAAMPDPGNELNRHKAAIEQIHLIRELSKEDRSEKERLRMFEMAMQCWSLLAAEIGDWFMSQLDIVGIPNSVPSGLDPSGPSGRVLLEGMLSVQEANRGSPLHRRALDPASIFLPRPQALQLLEALEALDAGEVRPLFQATATGRHGDTKTWDDMRNRALEHVAFLVGQGVKKGIARARVGAAMKNVSVNTLKTWERTAIVNPPILCGIELANKAGDLAVMLQSNPKYAEIGSGKSIDAGQWAKLKELTQEEDLLTFGARYATANGRRHNS
jgi:hypothetical protein